MSFRIRPASGEDFPAIYEMAKLTGGGFTNLPPDRGTLVAKLARSDKSFARKEDGQEGDMYMFVLEDPKARLVRGTTFGAGATMGSSERRKPIRAATSASDNRPNRGIEPA